MTFNLPIHAFYPNSTNTQANDFNIQIQNQQARSFYNIQWYAALNYPQYNKKVFNVQTSKTTNLRIQKSKDINSKKNKHCTKERRDKLQRSIFTINEDKKLIELYSIYKDDWQKISEIMPNRTARQCKERYYHYLTPNISQSQWTDDEDSILIQKVGEIGKKWKVLEQFFEGRTEINIRNRWNMLERKEKKRNEKTKSIFNTNAETESISTKI